MFDKNQYLCYYICILMYYDEIYGILSVKYSFEKGFEINGKNGR